MRKLLLMFVFAAASMLGAAEVIFDGSKVDSWADEVTEKAGVITIKGDYKVKLSKDFTPVTRGRKYTISGEFFIPAGAPKAQNILYFGFIPYTADGKEITHTAIATAIPYAVATLAADAKAGDKSVTLKNAADWKLLGHGCLAFNAKADRSDLPNFELSGFLDLSKTVKNSDGTVTVALKTPLAKSYPAGTLVRQHRSGNMFPYVGFGSQTGKWITFTQTTKNFYLGTAQIKLAVRFLNRNWPIQMRNVKVVAE